MIERWTIDVIADQIEDGLRKASPSPRLLRRCYRHGYRHGRRAIPAGTARALISSAVDVASSAIAQEYVTARDELQAQQRTAGARIVALAAAINGWSKPDVAPQPNVGAAATAAEAGTSLQQALISLEDRREKAKARAAQEQLEELQRHLQEAEAERDRLTGELHQAPARFRQQVASCHDAGHLLWARYCQGFVKGASKRGNPDNEDELIDSRVEFVVPATLAERLPA